MSPPHILFFYLSSLLITFKFLCKYTTLFLIFRQFRKLIFQFKKTVHSTHWISIYYKEIKKHYFIVKSFCFFLFYPISRFFVMFFSLFSERNPQVPARR